VKEKLTKIKTYVGFAEKSGKLIIGTDNLLVSKKLKLILISDELGESAQKKLNNYALRESIIIYKLMASEIQEIYSKGAIKALGIIDKNLADAVIKIIANKN